jgi:hypothetical protein
MSRMCQHVVAALNRRFKDVILSEGAGSTVLTRLMHKKNYRTLPPLHPPSHTRMHTPTQFSSYLLISNRQRCSMP